MLYVSIMWVFAHYLDEFHLKSGGSRLLSDFVNTVFSDFYPTNVENSILVFEIDRNYVAEYMEHERRWPLTYEQIGYLVEDIDEHLGPRGIFLDFWFTGLRPNESLAQLVQSICALGGSVCQKSDVPEVGRDETHGWHCISNALALEATPVFIGDYPPETRVGLHAQQALRALAKSCAHVEIVGLHVNRHFANQRLYPIVSRTDLDSNPTENAAPSIFRSLCKAKRLSDMTADCHETVSRLDQIAQSRAQMEIIWGGDRAGKVIDQRTLCSNVERNLRVTLDPLQPAGHGEETETVLGQLLQGDLPQVFSSISRAPCPYLEGISATKFDEIIASGAAATDLKGLSNRIVMVGTSPADETDIYYGGTSLDVEMNGTYAHAMALDNILVFREDLKSTSLEIGSIRIDVDYLFFIISILISFLFCKVDTFLDEKRLTFRNPYRSVAIVEFSRLVTAFVTLGIIGIFSFYLLNLGVQQWVATGSYATFVGALAGAGISRRSVEQH